MKSLKIKWSSGVEHTAVLDSQGVKKYYQHPNGNSYETSVRLTITEIYSVGRTLLKFIEIFSKGFSIYINFCISNFHNNFN